MNCKVLESFHYAADGKHPNLLRAGTMAEIRDEHVARFEAEGKIERAASPDDGAASITVPMAVTFEDRDRLMSLAAEIEGDGTGEALPEFADGDGTFRIDDPDAPGRAKPKGKGRSRK